MPIDFCSKSGINVRKHGTLYFYYHVARFFSNSEYEQIADELLDKVSDNLSVSMPPDFENGLAGIGWGIEYLVRESFIEADTDEILKDIDDKIFSVLNENKNLSIELTKGLTGYLFYTKGRLKNFSTSEINTDNINIRSLDLIVNKIGERVSNNFPLIFGKRYFDLFWSFPMILLGLLEVFNLNLFKEKIKYLIHQWLPYMEDQMPSIHINRLFLALIIHKLNFVFQEKQLEILAQKLLRETNFNLLINGINPTGTNVRSGYKGAAVLLQIVLSDIPMNSQKYEQLKLIYTNILDKHKRDFKELFFQEQNIKSYSVSEGLAGIGLAEVLFPDKLSTRDAIKTKKIPAISCTLFGGLGNQLFQIATAYSLALDNNAELVVNLAAHKQPPQGGKATEYKENIFRKLKTGTIYPSSFYMEKSFKCTPIPYSSNLIISGYFQSEKYFCHNKKYILDLLLPSESDSEYIRNKYADILCQNTCSIHVRRGDYLQFPSFFTVCSLDYYKSAIKIMPKGSMFLIFSDDVAWCKKILLGRILGSLKMNPIILVFIFSQCVKIISLQTVHLAGGEPG